jgi:predicted DCC family thiol-disulfide oxidoreductase YuxK
MRTLYLLFDARCGLCTEIGGWLAGQPAFVELKVLSSDSEEARRKFPSLPPGELSIISDSGEVWLGNNAFLVCLWALRGYRSWAYRLSTPLLRPMARQAFAEISHNRHAISKLLGLKSESDLRKHLSEVDIPPCSIP